MEQPISHGCGCAHKAEKPTEILSDEHRVIERVLSGLEQLTKLPIAGSLEHWRKALDFFRHFADQCHHFKEERVLFPVLEEHGIPREGGPIGMMLQEHEEARAHVRSMAAAIEQIATGNAALAEPLVSHARAYLILLREHIQKEDDILFRMADEVIPQDEQRQLLRRFEEHEAEEMGAGAHEKYLKIAEELEAKTT
ncbi:MAG TPA: hemerythrin domain-containing protein [Candidatus Binatia bacterium]|jgi:hemerythrin-like domain-containing protein|nr:hemerythrin domain-containing protein [Candidatus Binatia bacterium]